MADHQDVTRLGATAGEVALGLAVDLGDEGASGVEIQQVAAFGFGGDGFGHAVGGEHDVAVLGHLVQFVHEHGALALELFHHVAVMDDLVADEDGGPVTAEGFLDDADGAVDTGAEATRAGQQDAKAGQGGRGRLHVVHCAVVH